MEQPLMMPVEFWLEVERHVSAKVDNTINLGKDQRAPLISYLRDLEVMARTACDRRQTVQIIASGRSVLGDRKVLGPSDGPFAHTCA